MRKRLEIEELLPHRPPFLFIEEIVEANKEGSVGRYRFKENELFFAGHFPHYPIVPGVILIEMMAQCGGAGVNKMGYYKKDTLFVLASVEKAKFRQEVFPNAEVKVEVKNLRTSKLMLKQSGKVYVGEDVVAEATWLCVVKELDG
ncbi:MAG: 3-hydroxyacyl-ACP dehydratase FabZ family protein [Sphaerochaetaceae bacterium]|jgi:3-hydroxyacyl-[acyl-carrier-protein] dehydratase|nr:beta-hydroxyacyl-ACP dehydratase [Sphaerochaetaceae bacterium]HHU88276.1 beta-hydroxyacyl-ACP dehydratase [Spirochaetales bacterium]